MAMILKSNTTKKKSYEDVSFDASKLLDPFCI